LTTQHEEHDSSLKHIVVYKNGPYFVYGDLPLVIKKQVVSEYGEPLTWEKTGEVHASPREYHVCRCGQSGNQPFCDGSHRRTGFDGTETADTGTMQSRATEYTRGTRIYIRKDATLCSESGFCGLHDTDLDRLVAETNDTKIRSLVIAMVERCPSGALTYRFETNGNEIEPDLPLQVALTTEITQDGPIPGPLWVTGGVPVERSDGQPFEVRNRVTLCNCGRSHNKPLCDGTHRKKA
jgi:CDGSH-type Zn-finger protein